MSKSQKVLRTLEPTIVPAHPGYKMALFSAPADNSITQDTKPEDLWLGFDPVIAWSIQHVVEVIGSDNYVTNAHLVPITPEGILDDSDPYLVSSDGK